MSRDNRRAIVVGEGALTQSVAAAIEADGFAVERIGADLRDLGAVAATDLIVVLPDISLRTVDFSSLDEASWVDFAERPLNQMRMLFAAASGRLREPNGAMLIVLPNIGMIGVAGTAAQTMAAEAIRSLSKAVAKSWRGRGLKVNCAILSCDQFGDEDQCNARNIAGIATATAASSFVATGNSILIDGDQVSV